MINPDALRAAGPERIPEFVSVEHRSDTGADGRWARWFWTMFGEQGGMEKA